MLNNPKSEEEILDWTKDHLNVRRQTLWAILGGLVAAITVLILWATEDGGTTPEGVTGVATAALTGAIGVNGIFGFLGVSRFLRQVLLHPPFNMLSPQPCWTPAIHGWSYSILWMNLVTPLGIVGLGIPILFAIFDATSNTWAPTVPGLAAIGISSLAAAVFLMSPHHWLREMVVQWKYSALAQLNGDSSVCSAERPPIRDVVISGLEQSQRIDLATTIGQSPNSPVNWFFRGIPAILALASPFVVWGLTELISN